MVTMGRKDQTPLRCLAAELSFQFYFSVVPKPERLVLYVENPQTDDAKIVICSSTNPDLFAARPDRERLSQPAMEEMYPEAFATTQPYEEDGMPMRGPPTPKTEEQFKTPPRTDLVDSDGEPLDSASKRARMNRYAAPREAVSRSPGPAPSGLLSSQELESRIE